MTYKELSRYIKPVKVKGVVIIDTNSWYQLISKEFEEHLDDASFYLKRYKDEIGSTNPWSIKLGSYVMNFRAKYMMLNAIASNTTNLKFKTIKEANATLKAMLDVLNHYSCITCFEFKGIMRGVY